MALIVYARVSTAEQDTALQADALRKAGCERIFEDTASGATAVHSSIFSRVGASPKPGAVHSALL